MQHRPAAWPIAGARSALLNTSSSGTSSAPDLGQHVAHGLDVACRIGRAGVDDVDSRSASTTTSSVERNASTSWWGSLRTKPTVSVTSTVSPPGKRQPAGGGVERGEQPVLDEHARRVGEPVEQRRLAGVRVADDGDRWRAGRVAAALRCVCAVLAICAQVGLELVDAAHDAAAVDLELGLARAAGADAAPPAPHAAGLLRERSALPPQAGQAVAELGQLDLGLALLAVGVLGEDVEDHRGAVDGRAPEQLLEVELLGRASARRRTRRCRSRRPRPARAAPRPCPCRCRSPGRAPAGAGRRERPRRRRRCRPAARARRATPRSPRPSSGGMRDADEHDLLPEGPFDQRHGQRLRAAATVADHTSAGRAGNTTAPVADGTVTAGGPAGHVRRRRRRRPGPKPGRRPRRRRRRCRRPGEPDAALVDRAWRCGRQVRAVSEIDVDPARHLGVDALAQLHQVDVVRRGVVAHVEARGGGCRRRPLRARPDRPPGPFRRLAIDARPPPCRPTGCRSGRVGSIAHGDDTPARCR